MGGSSKKQTVGYKYYLGMHMILCHGPVDHLRRIYVDTKTAINGKYTAGQISINKPNLFGGEKREGGIVGTVDLEMGGPSQSRNSYLQARLGSSIPAFRGVVGVVLRQVYLGVNPYLKRWAFRLQRVYLRQNGIAQWYENKAGIGTLISGSHAIYIALDTSNSMNNVTSNGKTRLENAQIALNDVLDYIGTFVSFNPVDIYIIGWDAVKSTMLRRNCDLQDISDLKTFVNGLSTIIAGTTDFELAVSDVASFYAGSSPSAKRTVLFITDGEPYVGGSLSPQNAIDAGELLFSTSGVESFGFNIDLADTTYTEYMDNTPEDGVPVVDGSDSSDLTNAIQSALSGQIDMNPAHIIRECLTDPDWGMGYQDADIDDVSFTAAADTLFSENMGISLLWDRQNTIEAFVNEIAKHIDAALYVDRVSGKFALKLIRGDYDEGSLIELDESNVSQIQNLSRASFGELVNSVTVNYWDADTGETASLTAQDIALAQMQNAVINTTVQYPGFTNSVIASRVASRDLKALSTPLWSCTVYADKTAEALNIGDVFKLSWSDYGLNSVVMRVTGMAFGNSKSNKVKLICVQDVFTLPEPVVSAPNPTDGWTPIDNSTTPLTSRLVIEAPYYELVQLLGQTAIDDDLTNVADLGYVMASGGRPSSEGAINALVYVDSGAGYEDSDTMDFSPIAFLAEDIDENTLTFSIENGEDLDIVEVGQHCQIEDELCRVDAISGTSITIGRAVLDTSPKKHLTGALIVFWDNYPASDEVEYVASDSVNVKLLTVTGEGILDESAAPVDNVVLNSRAIRPYPPGNLKIDGLSYPTSHITTSTATLTWSHRDRLQQTSGSFFDHSYGNIGPEAGTTYQIKADAILADTSIVSNWLNTNVGSVTTWEFDPTVDVPPATTLAVILKVFATRDGYESLQAPEVQTIVFAPPSDLTAVYAPLTAPANLNAVNF